MVTVEVTHVGDASLEADEVFLPEEQELLPTLVTIVKGGLATRADHGS